MVASVDDEDQPCGPKAAYSLPRRSQRRFYGPFTSVVQKTALTAIVDQAYNLNERPLLRRPTAEPPFGIAIILLSDCF